MMGSQADKFISGATAVGVLLFMFLNADKVTSFFRQTADAAVGYIGGIATIGQR